MKEITTEIEIKAPRDQVWKVITEFNNWTDWNPSVKKMTGPNSVGSTLDITMCNKTGGEGPKYQPTITEVEEGKYFRWRAKMGMGFIFTNDKLIELHEAPGGTKLVHKELFSGLMLMMMGKHLDSGVGPMLEGMNRALKDHVEKKAA